MFQRMIDDFKDSTGIALRMTFLVTAAAIALFITTSFLCAAIFIAVLQAYGPVQACLAGAGVFLVVALIAAGSYMVRKRQAKARAAQAAKSAMRATLVDPMVLAAALQIVRAVGIKRLVPIIAIGGVALGLFAASRTTGSDQEAPAE